MRGEGYQKLWGLFGLSYASFYVMPRILMHEMSDEWQGKMAALLEEYEAMFSTEKLPACKVMAVSEKGKFASWPDWVLNYRRPELSRVDELRSKPCEDCGKLAHECPCIDALIASVSHAPVNSGGRDTP